MSKSDEGQLSFDWSQATVDAAPLSNQANVFLEKSTSPVVCLQSHRLKREESERSYHFSEIIKLVAHLKR